MSGIHIPRMKFQAVAFPLRLVFSLIMMMSMAGGIGLSPAVLSASAAAPDQAQLLAANLSSSNQPGLQAAPLVSRFACTAPIVNGAAPYLEWGTASSVAMPHGKISFLNDATHLYILVDVTGDTVADPPGSVAAPGDYSWVSFDVNRDGKITPDLDVNYATFPGTTNLGLQQYLAPNEWTGLGPTASLFGEGFGPSPSSPVAHRIFEYGILLSEIRAVPGDTVRTGIRAFSPKPSFTDDTPVNFTADFANLIQVQLSKGPCDISLVKHGVPSLVSPGDILTYQIDYSLTGAGTYTDVTISDPVPSPDVTFLPGSASPAATYSAGVLTWHLGNLPGGSSGSVKFQVLVQNAVCGRQRVILNAAQISTGTLAEQAVSGTTATEVLCRPVGFPTNEPPYAESEITVNPYPLVTNQLTKICTTIHNNTNVAQTVNVEFDLANFGIGMPFTPIVAAGNPRAVVIPPNGNVTVCIFWHPTTPGHQCVQVVVSSPTQAFTPMRSQRNLDVAEVLIPGKPATFNFPVGNQSAVLINVAMIVRNNCPGWTVQVNPATFQLLAGTQQNVVVTVTPPANGVLGTGCTVDIEAWEVDPKTGGPIRLIGGIRKIDNPQVPLGPPGEVPFAEKEIRINPYPLISGVPTQICVSLSNNTGASQTVQVAFMLANLGIGLPFNLIPATAGPNPRTVVIPAHTSLDVCIWFVPTGSGHHCLAVKLTIPGTNYATYSYQNLDVAERLKPGVPTQVNIPVANPTAAAANIDLVVDNTCPGWTASVNPATLLAVGANSADIRTVTLTVTPPSNGVLGINCHIDLLGYINGSLIGGVRKIDRPPVAPPVGEVPYAEREITVNPNPPVVGKPANVCVTLVNPTDVDQKVNVTFSAADFGAGINFTAIQTVNGAVIPAHGTVTLCIVWTPAPGGTLHRCIQVQIHQDGYQDIYSQRNLDLLRFKISDLRPGAFLVLPDFLIHNPGPDPAPFVFDLMAKGINPALLDIQLMDAATGKQVMPGDVVNFMGNESRRFFLRLGLAPGIMSAMEPSAPSGIVGDDAVIDVIPYQNGQQLMVNGQPSGVEFEIDPLAHLYLPYTNQNH
ncbi:MAG: hypothetical protein ACM3PY_18480 [Omnitrophica WOR_2 bacterium]